MYVCMCDVVSGSSVVNGGSTHQVLSPMAVTTFQVNPNNGQPAIIDPALISQYSGQLVVVERLNSDVLVDINLFVALFIYYKHRTHIARKKS